ncbi:PREDICTED: synaptic vesicle glycoprotein 2B [Papilio polytes]|uniref:synaptic vesicle glycoprotein 2B n=1 Tax=Papilio polytes TaxID=76194 RepID=UPI000675FF23|nr:PREDICTED: synaptic vesicle glycoprotein 2B [Papilio polytes]
MVCETIEKEDQLPFDEALEKTGNGIYNILLSATCALSLLAIGADLFGFSLVVAAACDLNLTVAQKGILTSTPFVGILLVSYIWGYVSDTRGRRVTLLLSLTFGFLLSSVCSLSIDWISLGVLKFLSVCFSCAANSVSYTLVGESCVQRVRNKYMVMMTCFILLSPAFAALLTYPILKLDFEAPIQCLGIIFRPWRLLNIILALPSGLGAFAMYFFHESPKFLANCGRREEALEVMRSIYAVNHSCSKEEFGITCFTMSETAKKEQSLFRAMYEQSAPLFRPPYLWRTLQLYFIVAVVFITNNSFLVWLPHILNLIRISLQSNTASGNVCDLISTPDTCVSTIDENVIITLMISQTVFAFLNFVISYLPNHRRKLMIGILCLSTLSGFTVSVVPEPISSVVLFMVFTSTCLGMGILASYFVDQYPTTYRGMVSSLSIMVGRSSSFVGINLVGNVIFHHCRVTFNLWSLLVLCSVIAAWFLPPDKPMQPAEKPTKL